MKYRKKPVVIEAFQMTVERARNDGEWPDWLLDAWHKPTIKAGALYPNHHASDGSLLITTLEGVHNVGWNDFIIQGIHGELYPCKPDIFDATYEAVEEE